MTVFVPLWFCLLVGGALALCAAALACSVLFWAAGQVWGRALDYWLGCQCYGKEIRLEIIRRAAKRFGEEEKKR